jgi:riboflavin biosynthesis pyrimidine reductase
MGGGTFRVSEKQIRERAADGRLIVVMTRQAGGGALPEGREGVVEFTGAESREVVAELRARGMRRCALLGGGKIYGAFLAAGLVDEVWLTLEPRIFGAGVALAGGAAVDARLRLLSSERLSADVLLLKYELVR